MLANITFLFAVAAQQNAPSGANGYRLHQKLPNQMIRHRIFRLFSAMLPATCKRALSQWDFFF